MPCDCWYGASRARDMYCYVLHLSLEKGKMVVCKAWMIMAVLKVSHRIRWPQTVIVEVSLCFYEFN